MTPENQHDPIDRERRVRRVAGLLVAGASLAAIAVAVPAFASTRTDAASGVATTITTAVAATNTTASAAPEPSPTTTEVPAPDAAPAEAVAPAAPAPTPTEELAAKFAAMTPEEQAAFRQFVSPPPPPPAPAPAPKPAPKPAAPAATGGGSPPNSFLACVRQRESHGQYGINTGNGYYGAYQFSQSTWNNTARHAGRGDLVGRAPSSVSPADQDAMAASLYAWQGRAPWAGPGC